MEKDPDCQIREHLRDVPPGKFLMIRHSLYGEDCCRTFADTVLPDAELDRRDAARERNEVLLVRSVGAAIALGEATATALKNGHANGETEAALQYAQKIKHEQKDFLTEQGIHAIY